MTQSTSGAKTSACGVGCVCSCQSLERRDARNQRASSFHPADFPFVCQSTHWSVRQIKPAQLAFGRTLIQLLTYLLTYLLPNFVNVRRVCQVVRVLLFLIFCISQGSVMTRLVMRGKYDRNFCCKLTTESNSERIVTVGEHSSKFCLRLQWHFLAYSVVLIIIWDQSQTLIR